MHLELEASQLPFQVLLHFISDGKLVAKYLQLLVPQVNLWHENDVYCLALYVFFIRTLMLILYEVVLLHNESLFVGLAEAISEETLLLVVRPPHRDGLHCGVWGRRELREGLVQ